MKKIIELEKIEDLQPYGVLEHINFHRSRGIGFRVDYTPEVHKKAQEMYSGYHAMSHTFLKLWAEFEKHKTSNSVIDFGDMLHLVVRRIRTDKPWAEALSKTYHHVLMDEAQDTSIVQWEFVNGLLSPENKNLYCVGDVSQAIYSFSGASPELLVNYSKDWRGLQPSIYKLAKNHRSVPQVVNLANSIQSKMVDTIPLKMVSYRGEQGEVGVTKLIKGALPSDVAAIISQQIYRDNTSKTLPYKGNAILVRSGSLIRDMENALVRLRIPYIIRGGKGLMQTEEVRDVLSYLRIATNPKDFMAFVRSAAVPKRGAGDVMLEKIRDTSIKQHDGNLIEAAWAVNSTKLGGYVGIIREIQSSSTNPVIALETVIRKARYKEYLTDKYKKEPERLQDKLENLERLAFIIGGMFEDSGLTTEDIVFQLSMNDQTREIAPEGKVVVSTIHAAKGLEWSRVYLFGAIEGQLPHKFSKTALEIQEERRVFYVACTRARDTLVICINAMNQNFKGAPTPIEPSRFLAEVGIR